MLGTVNEVLIYLISTIFDLFLYILIFRFILATAGADSSQPIVQMIVRMTSFITTPVRNIIPDYRGIEVGTLVLIVVIDMLKNLLRVIIPFGVPKVVGLIIGTIVMSIGDTLYLFSQAIFVLVLIRALLSWIQPSAPINPILDKTTTPILRPFQKLIPPINGLDFSPVLVLVLIQLIALIVLTPVITKGYGLALG